MATERTYATTTLTVPELAAVVRVTVAALLRNRPPPTDELREANRKLSLELVQRGGALGTGEP